MYASYVKSKSEYQDRAKRAESMGDSYTRVMRCCIRGDKIKARREVLWEIQFSTSFNPALELSVMDAVENSALFRSEVNRFIQHCINNLNEITCDSPQWLRDAVFPPLPVVLSGPDVSEALSPVVELVPDFVESIPVQHERVGLAYDTTVDRSRPSSVVGSFPDVIGGICSSCGDPGYLCQCGCVVLENPRVYACGVYGSCVELSAPLMGCLSAPGNIEPVFSDVPSLLSMLPDAVIRHFPCYAQFQLSVTFGFTPSGCSWRTRDGCRVCNSQLFKSLPLTPFLRALYCYLNGKLRVARVSP